MRIDAHQHVWRLSRGDYGWLTPALGPIHRDVGPAELAPLLERNGIARSILVQAAPTRAETAFLLGIARETPFVAGVVGWCDLEAPTAAADIAALAAEPLLVGLRPMVHDIADEAWLGRASLGPAFEAMAESGLVFDALVRPVHLPHLLGVVRRHPRLVVVVDHAAKPDLAAGRLDPWRADLAAVAACPNAFCKLSGLVTEAGPGWTDGLLRPVVDHLLACFGAERLVWGSDWPVLTLAASYDGWVAASERLLAGLGPDARAAVMGGNARRIYLSNRGRDRC